MVISWGIESVRRKNVCARANVMQKRQRLRSLSQFLQDKATMIWISLYKMKRSSSFLSLFYCGFDNFVSYLRERLWSAWASSNYNLFNLMCSLTLFSLDLRCINDKNRLILLKKRACRIKTEAWLKIVCPNQYWPVAKTTVGNLSLLLMPTLLTHEVVRTMGLLIEMPVSNVWQKNKLLLN